MKYIYILIILVISGCTDHKSTDFEQLPSKATNIIRMGNGWSKFELEGKLVEYVDFDSHHGEMGAFRKYQQWHEHQQEFRFMFEDNTSEKDKIISLGPLNDIAELFPTSDINNIIKITNNA